jgi:uncharacterized protein YjbI with pentapeptide repeats
MPGREAEPATKRRINWPRWTGLGERTLWDVLQLLIVPIALAVIGFLFTMQQDARQQAIADQRAEIDRKVEEERAQDAALQGYLEYMSQLLLENSLRSSEADSEVRSLARARTLTVLQQLRADPKEEDTDKEQLMEFLIEAGLISRVDGEDPVISLEEAHLRGTDLDYEALHGTDLEAADLRGANLAGAHLEGADLSGANLSGAELRDADLSDAELTGANLRGAKVADYQLAETGSLTGATMPNGKKYEEWLKSKGRGEDGENE